MRLRLFFLLVVAGCLLILGQRSVSMAQPAPQDTRSGGLGGGAASGGGNGPGVRSKLIPEVRFVSARLEQVIDTLRQQDPELQVLVERDADAAADIPLITMTLKNVTGADVVRLISSAYPWVEMVGVETQDGRPLYGLRVHNPDQSNFSGSQPRGVHVKVYNLGPILDGLLKDGMQGATPEQAKQAMGEVLSLIEAAVRQASGGEFVLQAHAATHTLIFKGTGDQEGAAEAAINALMPHKAAADVELMESERRRDVQEIGDLKLEVQKLQERSTTQPSSSTP